MKIYRKAGVVAERPHLNLPKNTFEEELGLEGFFGPVSHLYHGNAPTDWSHIERSNFQWSSREISPESFLRPQCYRDLPSSVEGDFFESSRLYFWNDDLAVYFHRLTRSSPMYFRNSDASEMYFCHDGSAELDSVFGRIDIQPGDYCIIPRGVTYRWKSTGATLMRVESFKAWFKKPETGILGQQALYHEESIVGPQFEAGVQKDKESIVLIQKEGILTKLSYPFDLRNLSGWMGTLYPYKLPISKIAPIMSSMAHLPPSINATFVCPNFIVCTFLPRPLEEPEGALKVPFYHSNIDYDEIILYHAGDFFSRDNMKAGYITLHPRGINHGPHPKALAGQNNKKRTDEIAVMIDTVQPLKVSAFARGLENADYWKSWKRA